MAKFSAGDVVSLKSGGVKMTVVEYVKIVDFSGIKINNHFSKPTFQSPPRDSTKVKCIWFDDKQQKAGQFEEATLEIVS